CSTRERRPIKCLVSLLKMPKQNDSLTFENALGRLENILESMESGDTPLADLVAKFEEGSNLLKVCQAKLKEAELKIEKLNITTGEVEPFEDDSAEA
ncbi:MAG: exodeoxyribonuclease VII small subunit, partial [Lentimonas sp.]